MDCVWTHLNIRVKATLNFAILSKLSPLVSRLIDFDKREGDMQKIRQTIQVLLQALSVITFGDFDEFNRVRSFEKTTVPLLSKVNVTQLLLEV